MGETMIDTVFAHLKRDLAAIHDGSMGKIRGYCATCDEPIKDADAITYANEQTYHRAHFACTRCSTALFGVPYVLVATQPVCNTCYTADLCPKCTRCALPIASGRILSIKDGTMAFHEACFACSTCNTALVGTPFFETPDGGLACRACYSASIAPECARCGGKIGVGDDGRAEMLVINEKKYHQRCFTCYECGAPFEDMKALQVGDKFLCKADFDRIAAGAAASAGAQ
ncbi:hypothetical protein GGF31_002713 [Allomyces arbusculus]|nr:hypothetical protein GGF31_002713 [Allomyces arbusculus]